MSKRSIACGIVGSLATVCCVVLGCKGSSDPSVSRAQGTPPVTQARFITVPEVFGTLDRPPVRFDHDKHVAALEDEGCKACHRTESNGDLAFTFEAVEGHSGKTALVNAFHDGCISCHTKRAGEHKKAGPQTCGECHVADRQQREHEYVPKMPDYYEVLRDTYHSECMACHREPSKVAENAGALDWKSFYITQKKTEAEWPKVSFDYLLHDKHDKALEGKCELCHYIPPQKLEELKAEGKEPAGRDWVLDVDETHSLTERTSAHARCVNCHVQRKARQLKAGPVLCEKCHHRASRTVEELADVPRPECESDSVMLLQRKEGARAKAVAFSHEMHVAASRSCQDCHHKTLRACEECHTVDGSEEGNWITLSEAHHEVTSTWSCIGCHEAEKQKADCAGCHQIMPTGLVNMGCSGCHTGDLKRLESPHKLPAPKELIPDDVKDKIEITRIEDVFGPAKMPHLEIVQKLTEISNNSALASYFHTDSMTMCRGCHHVGPLEPKGEVPACVTCHTARDEPISSTPTLLGSYHQRCLGCHQLMDPTEQKLPQTCTGCHEEKALKGAQLAARGEG